EAFKLLEKKFPCYSNELEDHAQKRQLLSHLEAFLLHINTWLNIHPTETERIEKEYLTPLLTWMYDAFITLGDTKKQKELLERVLLIERNHYGKDHFEVAITLTNLGSAYGALGDPERKKEVLERALLLQENHYGKDHLEVVATLLNLCIAYGDLGN